MPDSGPGDADRSAPAEPESRPIAVLIVDDEPLIRWALAETLKDLHCQVVEAADARSALDALTKEPTRFDVIVLDYRLPDAHDLTLMATVRQLSPHSRVILLSAFLPPEVNARALALGAWRLLHKPHDLNAIAALVMDLRNVARTAPSDTTS